jgi:hypothetical protein
MKKNLLVTIAVIAGVGVAIVMVLRLTHTNMGALWGRTVIEHHEQKYRYGAVAYDLVWDKNKHRKLHEFAIIREDEHGKREGNYTLTLSGSADDDATGFRSRSSQIVRYSLYDSTGRLFERFDGDAKTVHVANDKGQLVTYGKPAEQADIERRVEASWRNRMASDVMMVVLSHNEQCKCEAPCWKKQQK